MIKSLSNAFNGLEFYEPTHTYKLNGKELNHSVSEYIGKYKNKFDKNISKFVAAKRGVSVQSILDEWEATAHQACTKGTAIHYALECMVLGNNFDNSMEYILSEDELVLTKNLSKSLLKKSKEVVTELCMYGELEGEIYGGMADLIIRAKDDKYILLDYKTNKELKFEGYRGQKMLGKYGFMSDCNMSHYRLQLNIYKKFIEAKSNIHIDKMYLIHIQNDGYKFYEIKKLNGDLI